MSERWPGSRPELPRYELLDHTSDLRVVIRGRDLPGLFANAAFCLFDIMLDIAEVREAEARTVELESTDLSELFLDWLRELLFVFSNGTFVPSRAGIRQLSPGPPCRLSAELSGEVYHPDRHGLRIEIKTPTYHQFELKATPDGWEARVVLDV